MSQELRIKYARWHPDGTCNEFQLQMFADFKTPILMGDAGVGSGKSYDLAMGLIRLSFLNKGVAGGLLCPSFSEFMRDMYPNFEKIFDENHIPMRFHRTEHTFIFPWSRKPLYVFTAEKRIKGPNLGWGGINEYSSIEYDVVEDLVDRRIRVPCPNPQIRMVGTPEDVYGWRETFIEKHLDRLRLIRGRTRDNLYYLLPGYLENMKKSLDPRAYQLWAEGLPVKLNSNSFYYAFIEGAGSCLTSEAVEQEKLLVHASVDFNVGNMSAILAHVIEPTGKMLWNGKREDIATEETKYLDVFGEIKLTDSQSDTEAMGRAIIKRFNVYDEDGNVVKRAQDRVLITCDASGTARKTSGRSDVKVLEDLGFTVRCKSANPRLRERQLLVNGLVHNKRIRINGENCKHLVKDLMNVVQDEKSFEKVKTNPELTHLSDALDYLVDYEFKLGLKGRDKFSTRSIHEH